MASKVPYRVERTFSKFFRQRLTPKLINSVNIGHLNLAVRVLELPGNVDRKPDEVGPEMILLLLLLLILLLLLLLLLIRFW